MQPRAVLLLCLLCFAPPAARAQALDAGFDALRSEAAAGEERARAPSRPDDVSPSEDRLERGSRTEGANPRRDLDPVERALSTRRRGARPGVATGETSTERTVLQSTHSRLSFDRDVVRVAVGSPEIASFELLDAREVLVLGRNIGRTSLIAWFGDGSVEQVMLAVRRDLSVLGAALRDIWPDIRAESAPDRDAVVLRGTVPDLAHRRAADQAARDYLSANRGGTGSSGQPLVRADSADAPAATGEALTETEEFRLAGSRGAAPQMAVINLIRVEALPATIEEKIASAIEPLGGELVRVRRVQRGDLSSDSADTFVLEGEVRDQVTLTRMLSVAAQVVTGEARGVAAIRVLGNEGGGLSSGRSGGSGGGGTPLASLIGTSGGFGSVTSRAGSGLGNDLGSNVARASALSVANGRILSFVTVEDLPQVRIETRLFQVNRTRLEEWNPRISVIAGDIQQGALLPTLTGLGTQGTSASRAGGGDRTDFQQALSLLGGALTTQPQIAGAKFVVDMLFSLLEEEGIARSLSQPSLTVLSGETASFQVGGEIPVPVSVQTNATSADGALLNSVVFVPFGVTVGIRPLVGDGDVVTLDVTPEITEPDPELTAAIRESTGTAQTTTAFSTRSLRTSARLEDGQALVVAGLLSRSGVDRSAFTPWFAQVPIVGWLGKRFDETRDESEVVIVVAPSIVRDPLSDLPLWAFPAPVAPGPGVASGAP